jgi:hypothetical protein
MDALPAAKPLNIAAYAEGAIYPSATLVPLIPSLHQAGWTTLILSLFHIGRTSANQNEGDIYFNDLLLISEGVYVGDPAWPLAVKGIKSKTLTRLLASVGGATPWVQDFQTIKAIYEGNNNSFAGTLLETNFTAFKRTFPTIDAIDMDCEETYDEPSFVAFCQMLIGIGFAITFCPDDSGETDFWVNSLNALETTHPGKVLWWNLQCYAGGTGNQPDTWAGYITTVMPDFDTDGFILASDWSRFWSDGYWQGDCVDAVGALLAPFNVMPSVGGAFIWLLDQILIYDATAKQHPDPTCQGGGGSQAAYVSVIAKSLSSAALASKPATHR